MKNLPYQKLKFFFVFFSAVPFFTTEHFLFVVPIYFSSDLNHSIATNIVRQIFLHSWFKASIYKLVDGI